MKHLVGIVFMFLFSVVSAKSIHETQTRVTQTVSAEGFGMNDEEAVACADAHWGAEVILEGECLSLAGLEPFAISDIVHGPCTCTFDDLQATYRCENLSTATCNY